MKKLLFSLIAIFLCIAAVPSYKKAAEIASEPQVQVKLVRYLGNQSSISLNIEGSYYLDGTSNLLISNKTYTVKVENGALSLYDGNAKLASGADLSITPVNSIDHAIINNREYAGGFHFTIENNQYVRPINSINLEDYVKSVVPAEMPGTWALEALKAQAVSARTYGYYHMNGMINDTTSYQVYGGISSLYPKATDAVNATAGEFLTYDNKIIDAVFSASNGGKTEKQFNSSSTILPYFKVQDDDKDTSITWNVTLHKQQINPASLDLSHPGNWWDSTTEADPDLADNIKAWLNSNGYSNKQIKIVAIPTLSFYEPSESGRYFKGDLTVQFFVKDQLDINGALRLQEVSLQNKPSDSIRSVIGSWEMKSNLFKIEDRTDAYYISGSGNGHGVGLSQYGAKGRAEAGQTYKDILSFYYPGTVLAKQYTPLEQSKLKTGWISLGSKWYYFDAKGVMKTGWVYWRNKWYFMDNTGVMKTGWVYSGYKWYYLDSTGVMKTGWVYSGNKWYYLDPSSGTMKTGWVYSGYKWYYLEGSGAMKTGWLKSGTKWYYLDSSSGAMRTGWVKVGGKWYYFYSSGVMAVNTTIRGYKINQYGVWVG